MVDLKEPRAQCPEAEVPARKVAARVREEEVCRIINLKRNLDYSDILIKYAEKYLKLGWDLVAVNSLGGADLELDFRESEEFWSRKLTSLGLEGVQVNLGVRTGKPSRLFVLEVHRSESLAPFNQRGEWGSGCVAEVGTDREQHYYVVPRGWPPPPSYFLESFQVMVLGEKGMVLAPPSLEPRARATLRWLRPPWENPPTRPSPALCKFLKESAPSLEEFSLPPLSQVPTWAEVYPHINRYPSVLQALLAPTATPKDYYQGLVTAARGVGLTDTQVLLGLLWHAPLGDGGGLTQRREYFQRLVGQNPGVGPENLPELRHPRDRDATFVPPAPLWGPADPGAEQAPGDFGGGPPVEAGFPSPSPQAPVMPAGSHIGREGTRGAKGNGRGRLQEEGEDRYKSWAEIFRFGRDNLVVDRRRYEAMIYELGKLEAWQEFFKQQHRENRQLREKIEGQWARELEFFRHLSSRGAKKGWRKW